MLHTMLKLSKILEEISNNTKFEVFEDEDTIDITLLHNNKTVGFIKVEFVFGGYYIFDDELSEDEYDSIFPNDKFAKIDYLRVLNDNRGKGFARLLVNKAIEIIKGQGENMIYLNASPMGHDGLSTTQLVNFYKSFGFKTMEHSDKWTKNKEMLLKL